MGFVQIPSWTEIQSAVLISFTPSWLLLTWNSVSPGDLEAQDGEWLVLGRIYDVGDVGEAESTQGGETRVYLDLPQNFKTFVYG